MLKRLERISTKLESENPFWRYKIDEYSYPNGKIGKYYYVETLGSTFVIPITNDGKFVLTKQFRYLNGKESLEFPGGGLKAGISPLENAIAELEEETGYSAKSIDFIGEFNPYNGVTSEICKVFLAQNLYKVNSQCDESEEFEIYEFTLEEMNRLISSNEIWDGMTLAAWSLFINSRYRKDYEK